MVCFVPSVCLSIRKSCQRRDCSELGTVRNWVDHCILKLFKQHNNSNTKFAKVEIGPKKVSTVDFG